jgi:hypothetical protein
MGLFALHLIGRICHVPNFQHRAIEVKAAQPAPRPASVAKVITKDVPLYLDEIGTCAAYETVQVPAQVMV